MSDISTKVTRKNVNVHYTETLTNSAEQGIISQVDFFDKEISNKDNINGYYIVDNNDFIYNPRISTLAPVGPINRNKLNRTGIMSPLYTVFRSSNVDLGFLEWYFQSSHWHRYMKLKGDSGARADRIAIKDSTFFEMPIKIPVNIKEQVLIGETLEKFNQYITLHQRKLDNLKLKKKALLQKLFPRNGERYPELRFPGFTDAWEQRKLEDVCNVYDGTHQTPRYTNSGVMFVSVEDIETLESNKYITEEDFKSEFKVFPEYGDILLTRIGDVGSANVILDEIKRAYYVSLALLKPKDINSLFLLALLSSSSVQSEIWRRTLHIAFPKKINKNEINKVIVNQPSIPEQKKIGKLFFSLDQTITLHQRKLEHLQIQKKSLLQKLFV